ncbi:putative DNA helicase protein [Neofusicoccum parvum]|uniref:DNA helicase protein n=1 Tax=Neofusicoccum parvum TaxID=310453 RepID=A0ACB5SPK0_9PEZI|nr:putative DNA helicase protein [Neofusicoccum parvum]
MAFQTAAATGSSGRLSGSVLVVLVLSGSSTDASRSSRSSRARYGSYCVLSSHGLTSSFSPSSMVARVRFSSSSQFRFALFHARYYSCSPPSPPSPPSWVGCTWSSYCGAPRSSGWQTLKYCEPWKVGKKR